MRDLARVDALARQHANAEAQMYLDAVVKRLQEANQSGTPLSLTTSVILSPDIAGTIIRQAEAGNCDVIAMATHGRGGLMRLLMGSVTERILSVTPHCHCLSHGHRSLSWSRKKFMIRWMMRKSYHPGWASFSRTENQSPVLTRSLLLASRPRCDLAVME